ncbi:hypothetical protein ACQP1G_24695 [Nocardia sp. CA-107356]|uniref:hypothetical protein n=1 Tax=Nocardia sp. CA-107356 TaxID=3239972 RepID=UPI003D918B6F
MNYAQTEDLAAVQRVIGHLMDRGLIDGNKRFGHASPGRYEVVFTLDRHTP